MEPSRTFHQRGWFLFAFFLQLFGELQLWQVLDFETEPEGKDRKPACFNNFDLVPCLQCAKLGLIMWHARLQHFFHACLRLNGQMYVTPVRQKWANQVAELAGRKEVKVGLLHFDFVPSDLFLSRRSTRKRV